MAFSVLASDAAILAVGISTYSLAWSRSLLKAFISLAKSRKKKISTPYQTQTPILSQRRWIIIFLSSPPEPMGILRKIHRACSLACAESIHSLILLQSKSLSHKKSSELKESIVRKAVNNSAPAAQIAPIYPRTGISLYSIHDTERLTNTASAMIKTKSSHTLPISICFTLSCLSHEMALNTITSSPSDATDTLIMV